MLSADPPVFLRVMIAHPAAGELALVLRQAARGRRLRLANVEYRLVDQLSRLSVEAFGPCAVMLLSVGFYRQLRLSSFTHLSCLLGPTVILLDEPCAFPSAHDVIQAINSGVQGWFLTPYQPDDAGPLLGRLHALLSGAAGGPVSEE